MAPFSFNMPSMKRPRVPLGGMPEADLSAHLPGMEQEMMGDPMVPDWQPPPTAQKGGARVPMARHGSFPGGGGSQLPPELMAALAGIGSGDPTMGDSGLGDAMGMQDDAQMDSMMPNEAMMDPREGLEMPEEQVPGEAMGMNDMPQAMGPPESNAYGQQEGITRALAAMNQPQKMRRPLVPRGGA